MKHYTAEDVLRLGKAELVGQAIMTDDNLSAMLFNKAQVAILINAAVKQAVEAEREKWVSIVWTIVDSAGGEIVIHDSSARAYHKECELEEMDSPSGGKLVKAIRARGVKE